MLVDISGTRDGVEWPRRGEVVDVPAGEADVLFGAGMAEAVSTRVADTVPTGEVADAAPPAPKKAAPPARKRR